MNTPTFPHRGLYAITNGPRADLAAAVEAALMGGARVVQYRDGTTDAARRRSEATALRESCRHHGATLLIEADAELAQAVHADGVHLRRPEDVAAARALLGTGAIIGVSARDSIEIARAAVAAGANYVSFGAFNDSPTIRNAPRASLDLLVQSAALGVPRVAIGGITPDNGQALVAAGADLIASVSCLFGATDIRAMAQQFSALFSADE